MPQYIYPPRPSSKMRPRDLPEREKTGKYLVQRKFNGDRCVTAIEGRKVFLGNRHGKWHSPSKFLGLRREILGLKIPSGLHYLDGELLKDGTLVLFDVLQIENNLLLGVSQTDRLSLLSDLCGNPTAYGGDMLALQVSESVWLAEHWCDKFTQHFEEKIDHDLIEGLVLRETDSVLDTFGCTPYEVDWQIRCRKPSKKYRY